MTNDMQQTQTTDFKPVPFGGRLKSARESIGLLRKDAAAQLRLSEKIITMMEKELYPNDLPITFIRGYIRSYGKLLQIPELEINQALEPLKLKAVEPDPLLIAKTAKPERHENHYMQIFTAAIIITLISLVGMWWYNHSSSPAATLVTQMTTAQTPPTSPIAFAPDSSVSESPTPLSLETGIASSAQNQAAPADNEGNDAVQNEDETD